jgi:alpha-glucosidase
MRWTASLLVIGLLLTACDDSSSSVPIETDVDAAGDSSVDTTDASGDDGLETACEPGEITQFSGANWSFVVAADGSWSAAHEDVLLQGPSPCGGVPIRTMEGEPSVRTAFGNFQIDVFADSATWVDAKNVRATVVEDGLNLDYELTNGKLARLSLRDNGRFQVETDAPGAEWSIACDANDSFFGLGSQVTGMDLRGRTYPLWTQEEGNGKKEGGGLFPFNNTLEAAYAPMGILHSSAGWTGILTHDAYSEVDVCSAGFVKLRSFAGLPGFQVVTGTPKERMKAVSGFVGTVGNVPDWVFGLWLDAVGGPWRVNAVAGRLRANDIPASAIWTEDWIGGDSTAAGYRLSYAWEWDQDFYPDLPTQISDLHDRGFAFLAYFNPFVPAPTRMFTEGEAGGFLIKNDDGTPTVFSDPAFRDASLVDLTNPAALSWLKSYQTRAITDLGVDGWMADFAEWLPVDTNLDSGQDPWTFHNPYPLAWQRANREAFEDARPDGNWAFFVRSGWASVNGGTGGLAPLFWGGDQNTNWEYDDGFPTIVPIGVHVGLSGVSIYGSDIAGYNSFGGIPTTTKELWFRWLATAAFHPLMRTHHGGMECANWHFDRDAESTAHMKRYATVHAMLFPYFQALLQEANNDGLPMTRHPWLVEPDRPELWEGDQYEFFLGDDLVIAPVLSAGSTQQRVRLPSAGWWPLFGLAPVDVDPLGSSSAVDVDVPVTEVPVFVRPGTALILLSEAPASFYGGNVTTLGDTPDRRIALYPDMNGDAAKDGPIQVVGTGLGGFEPTAASLDGNSLLTCNPGRDSCVDGAVVKVRCDDICVLSTGDATVTITVTAPTTVLIGIAGNVWGDLAEPPIYTPSTATNSWCDEAP